MDRGFVPIVVHALDGVRQISRLTKVLDGESVAYRQGEGDEGGSRGCRGTREPGSTGCLRGCGCITVGYVIPFVSVR